MCSEALPIEPRAYRNYYKKTLKKLGIPELKFHGMRHSFATRCIESKNSVKTVSVILGHSDITTTMSLYVHPNNKEKKRCIERMLKDILQKNCPPLSGDGSFRLRQAYFAFQVTSRKSVGTV